MVGTTAFSPPSPLALQLLDPENRQAARRIGEVRLALTIVFNLLIRAGLLVRRVPATDARYHSRASRSPASRRMYRRQQSLRGLSSGFDQFCQFGYGHIGSGADVDRLVPPTRFSSKRLPPLRSPEHGGTRDGADNCPDLYRSRHSRTAASTFAIRAGKAWPDSRSKLSWRP